MAYIPHLRVRYEGTLGGPTGPEIWSTGFALSKPDAFAGLPTVAQTNNMLAAFRNAMVLSGSSGVGDEVYIAKQTVSLIDSAGHVAVDGAGAFVQRVTTTSGNGNSGVRHPNQCANVLTLVTPRHGARGKGRLYLPGPNFTVQADGRIDPSVRAAAVNVWATAFGAINTALAIDGAVGPFHVAVASSKGEIHDVTQIRMGVVLDTQRRRRDALEENYETVSI